MGARSINGSKRPCRGAAERSRSLRKSPFAVLSGRPAACRQAARPGVPQPGRERPLAPTAPGLRVPRGQHRHAPPRGLLLGSTDFSATHRNKQRDEPPCSHAGKLAEEQRRVRTQRDLSNPHQKYKQQQKKKDGRAAAAALRANSAPGSGECPRPGPPPVSAFPPPRLRQPLPAPQGPARGLCSPPAARHGAAARPRPGSGRAATGGKRAPRQGRAGREQRAHLDQRRAG